MHHFLDGRSTDHGLVDVGIYLELRVGLTRHDQAQSRLQKWGRSVPEHQDSNSNNGL